MLIPSHGQNRLLKFLPEAEYLRITGRMKYVELEHKQFLFRFGKPIEYVYFPTRGAVSIIMVMEDGSAIEVATAGSEGVVGHFILDGDDDISPNDVIVQIAGEGLRIDAATFKEEASKDGPFRRLLLRYNKAFLLQASQSVACNGLHNVQQRCCRWLLISLDRMDSNEIPLTQEFLAVMLGVRRSTVSDILGPLHDKGLIKNSRGVITVVDRAGLEKLACECYQKVKNEFDRLIGGK